MKFLLDTDILSNFISVRRAPKIQAWMSERANEELYISALSLAEFAFGIYRLPAGKRRDGLVSWLHSPLGPQIQFAGRILPFDECSAMAWAQRNTRLEAIGRPVPVMDGLIAAIADANDCIVVTGNDRDYPEIRVFNPLS